MSNQPTPAMILAQFFQRNSYQRRQNLELFKTKSSSVYKKGSEIRLILKSTDELAIARQALLELGFKPGAAFLKAQQIVLPIYGKKTVERFLKMVEELQGMSTL